MLVTALAYQALVARRGLVHLLRAAVFRLRLGGVSPVVGHRTWVVTWNSWPCRYAKRYLLPNPPVLTASARPTNGSTSTIRPMRV